jgi:hypothetical protein
MELHTKFEELQQSPVFNAWKGGHEGAYLVHFFYMSGMPLQIGFYESKEDVITTFTLGETITQEPPSKVFKQDKSIAALDFATIVISFEEALEKAICLQKEKYSADVPTKEIVLLQVIDSHMVYNITFVTQSFHLLRVQIDAKTGVILEESKKPLMDLAASVE